MKLAIKVLIYMHLVCSIPAISRSDETLLRGIFFHGSTPGGTEIKGLLGIDLNKKVDFIRWNLKLDSAGSDQGIFTLDIVFGESKPNTLGFVRGGEKRSTEGKYTVFRNRSINGVIYHLKSIDLPAGVRMVKLNENLFHLLNSEDQLMVGDGGWSYTLNRKNRIVSGDDNLPSLKTSLKSGIDTSRQVTFDGRTPCQDFARDHMMTVDASCFKLKWRIILHRDPDSHEPTTYVIRKIVDNEPRDVSGHWTIVKGIPGNPEAIIYRLDPDDAEKSISLFACDENVIFFLDRQNKLYVGNGDFSFALNKKK